MGVSGENNRKKNPPKAESPVWRWLQNTGNGLKTDGKMYYEWDGRHNDIKVYNKNDDHIGSMDPVTGNIYKPAGSGRKLRRR
ncbi:MAG: Cytotoxic [Glomeribacter sp. 1016415]|nr:Cytotoxic [Glomeribacter sp. 1016415]